MIKKPKFKNLLSGIFILFSFLLFMPIDVLADETGTLSVYDDDWYKSNTDPQGRNQVKRLLSTPDSTNAYTLAYDVINNYADPDMFLNKPSVSNASEANNAVLDKKAKEITEGLISDSEKIKAIAYWVSKNTCYDYDYYRGRKSTTNITPYEVYTTGYTVCSGYANLCQYFLVSLDIPCMWIEGEGHAFNAAYDRDNKRWIFFDATWMYCNNTYEYGTKTFNDYCRNEMYDFSGSYASTLESHQIYSMECLLPTADSDFYYSLNYKSEFTWEDSSTWYYEVQAPHNEGNLTALKSIDSIPVSSINSLTERVINNFVPDSAYFYPTSTNFFSVDKVTGIDLSNTLITSLPSCCFYEMENLLSIVFPDSLTTIKYSCIDTCPKLEKLDMSNTQILSLPEGSFNNLDSLVSFTAPKTLTAIEGYTFNNCKALNYYDFSNSKLTKFGNYSLYFDASVNDTLTVKIPSSLTSSNKNAVRATNISSEKRLSPYWISEAGTKYTNETDALAKGETTLKKTLISSYITINYHLDGGTNSTLNPQTYDYTWSYSLCDASKSGYTFAGWYTDSEFKNRIYYTPMNYEGETLDLYAKFTENGSGSGSGSGDSGSGSDDDDLDEDGFPTESALTILDEICCNCDCIFGMYSYYTFGDDYGYHEFYYWYENGIRQGTLSDSKGVMGDGTIRGREIYDKSSNGWYWLDACYQGAKATGKEVWMPYIYQNELNWSDDEIWANANNSGSMATQVYEAIKAHQRGDLAGSGKWVRYDENGKMMKGWCEITGTLAELYPDQAGNTYYYDEMTGLMAKGEVTIEGVSYYFDVNTGALVRQCESLGTVLSDSERTVPSDSVPSDSFF